MTNNTLDNVQKNVEGAVDNVTHTFTRKDTHSYKGWLNSDSFLKRAFSILGYQTVASFIIMIPLYALIIGGALLFFGMAGGDRGDNMERGMRYDKEFSGQYRDLNMGGNSDYAEYEPEDAGLMVSTSSLK
jgi:hypothetical protein